MRICYLIGSCQQNIDTQMKWQRDTWLQYNSHDYFYITDAGDPVDPTHLGYTVEQRPKEYACHKYYEFLRTLPLEPYDWIVLIEDDTFIFPKRLEDYLATLNPSEPTMIGRCLPTMAWSVGAGLVFSRPVITMLKEYLTNTDLIMIPMYDRSDTTITAWVNELPDVINRISLPLLNHYDIDSPFSSTFDVAISYHTLRTEEQFKSLCCGSAF